VRYNPIPFVLNPASAVRLVVLVSAVLTLFYNTSCWRFLLTLVPPVGVREWLFYGSFAVLLTAIFSLLLLLMTWFRLLKPVLIIILFCTASATYFMNTYGVAIDSVMVQNVLETNTSEVGDLLSWHMLVYLVLLGALPSYWVWRAPIVYSTYWREVLQRLLAMVVCVLVIVAMVAPFYAYYAPVFREDKLNRLITPVNYIYSVGKNISRQWKNNKTKEIQIVGADSKPGKALLSRPRPSLVIMVVGETARADHFSLNGYERETNPELKKQDIINYTNVASCGTSTAVSVPCMFSKFDREDYSDNKGKTYENVLDMLQRAGVFVYWLDNNSDCKGTCLRIPNKDVQRRKNSPYCIGDRRCLDEEMLEDLQTIIHSESENTLIVLHADGSHGPAYFDRYSPQYAKFKPTCDTNQLSSCTQQAVINTYDNTILYTDHFLSQTIEFLKRNQTTRDVAMVYVSDHGESLGENGVYLHAAPYAVAPKAQTHVPMVAWFSPEAYKDWSLDQACLRQHQDEAYSHDNVFHTLLGLFDVQSTEYKPALDMFQPCRH
jgi:lipid A ethanolaminephosphotransferase